MRRRSVFACALLCASCSGAEDPREVLGSSQQAIIGGASSSGAEDAVVALVRTENGRSFGICTGTLLAPNLVLTARHCVSRVDPEIECDAEGKPTRGGKAGADLAAQDLFVIVGSERDLERPLDAAAARGREILHDGSKTICNHDIALLILDRSLEGALTAEPRLDAPVTVGERFTSVGWGVVETSATPSRRLSRRDLIVGGVGPIAADVSAGPAEFVTGEVSCSGDSGGPALSPDAREVLGVVSRGGNRQPAPFYDPALTCLGGTNVFTSVAPFRDLIERAHARARTEASATLSTTDWKRSSALATDDATRDPSCSTSRSPRSTTTVLALSSFLLALAVARRRLRL